ncbi:MAG: Anti-sigma-E factor ChrR [Alphaproteobacteria bacterium MarineAlpha2_Bin1]|nr:MAG: Anti-sigma-E factor ChrR [Alphaproteobacteria bacterium MarineAlpha2_Bin1]|tara:strand:- start:60 stop:704 length:645 start_codon:yes stop_codon:yes gene_type:complete
MHPTHHPSYEILLDYAAGNLPIAPSVIIATHCSICQDCNDTLDTINITGAALMDDLNDDIFDFSSLDKVLSKLEFQSNENDTKIENNNGVFDFNIPKTLQKYIPDSFNWKNLSSGVKTAELLTDDGFNLDIYKIKSGYQIPKHTHTGFEYTMVLDGGFTDNQKYFARGDFSLLDNSSEHSPKADPDKDCYCIVSMNSQIKLTGPIGRFINLINF